MVHNSHLLPFPSMANVLWRTLCLAAPLCPLVYKTSTTIFEPLGTPHATVLHCCPQSAARLHSIHPTWPHVPPPPVVGWAADRPNVYSPNADTIPLCQPRFHGTMVQCTAAVARLPQSGSSCPVSPPPPIHSLSHPHSTRILVDAVAALVTWRPPAGYSYTPLA